jgi:hypothetical protein
MSYNRQMPEEEALVPREELRATLAAQRELGPDYEAEVLDRFAAELERRIQSQLTTRRESGLTSEQKTGIVIVSIVTAIPMIAIASGTGLAGVVAVCVALVLVNAVALRR